MPQPNRGSAGKPNVSAPVSKIVQPNHKVPTDDAGAVPPVGIIKGTHGKGTGAK